MAESMHLKCLTRTIRGSFIRPYSISRKCGVKVTSESIEKQDMQYTYNVTLRRFRATIVVGEKQWVLYNLSVCTCSLWYPARNAHAPYCHVACPAVQYFSTLSHKRHNFRKKQKLLNTKCVFWFSVQSLFETFFVLRRNERGMIKNEYWSSCKVPVITSSNNQQDAT